MSLLAVRGQIIVGSFVERNVKKVLIFCYHVFIDPEKEQDILMHYVASSALSPPIQMQKVAFTKDPAVHVGGSPCQPM